MTQQGLHTAQIRPAVQQMCGERVAERVGVRRGHGSSVEEARNQLYQRLSVGLRPVVVVDVGANYGFTAAIFARHFVNAELILVEPDPKLGGYIERNMKANSVSNYRLVRALCGNRNDAVTSFGVNPSSSQDNRVRAMAGWATVEVPSVTISKLLEPYPDRPVFIKVDTQGFETQVFAGAEHYLAHSNDWFIKTEFGPHWLESQGNSAVDLLTQLVAKYRVVEAPARTRFDRDSLGALFSDPLKTAQISAFVTHVRRLNDDGLGWVDLYVAPKGSNKALE